MASNKKVITLGLDYSQLDAGTAEINRKMGLLEAQFKLTKEEIKSYATESDQLTLKQDKLNQQIILQTKKVEQSKEAYDKALASGTSTGKQLDNLQKAYLTNQTNLQKLNNELGENKNKLELANKSTGSFGDTIRGMASSLGLDVNPMVESLASKFDGVDKSIGTAVLTIGTVATALGGCTISAAGTADELLRLSSVSGLSTDTLQQLNYAAGDLEVSSETMSDSLGKLTRNMDAARDGSKEVQEAFKQLHVKIKDDVTGALLDSEDVFYKTIDALGKVKNETERDSLAMTVFGKSARELNPLIEAGSQRLRDLGIEAKDLGIIMGKDALEDLGNFSDSMDKMNQQMESVKMQLGLALLPVMQAFVDMIGKIPTPVLAGIVVFAALSAILLSLAKTFSSVAASQAMLAAANVAVGETGMVATAGMGPLLLILLAIAAVIAIIVGGTVALKNAMKDAQEAGSTAINGATQTAQNMMKTQSNIYKGSGYASGTNYASGDEVWVGETGPERMRVPRGSQVYTSAESKAMSGNTYISVTVPVDDLKQIHDVVDWAQGLKQKYRQGVVMIG